jgi:hypothetical protein
MTTPKEPMEMQFELDEALVVLERTPLILRAWLADLPPAWTEALEAPNTFSPREVLGHLLHGDHADWIPRLRSCLEHGESRTFTPYDRFAQQRLYGDWPLSRLLDEFSARRAANMRELRGLGLGAGDLDRRGRHPDFGAVTARQLLSTWVVHDLDHLGQIARVMARQYGDAVGPWRAYLPILGSRPAATPG